MRLGVLDVGSNTVHLLVVDAHRGGHPNPMRSEKTELRLAEHVERGYLTSRGATALVRAVAQARAAAAAAGCEELLAFATSALRDADNAAAVLERVHAETGVRLQVLPGEDEARYTFLALVAGALVAAAAMRTLRISELHICPWALREGVILRRLDTLASSSTSRKHWPLSDHPDRVPRTPAPSAAR
jgi:exopolyphosphatase/pppGpp-phosphohydrolase